MSRDKEQTKQQLIDAVGRLLTRDGYEAVGINAVAREANLDKVLIYRYFDGLDGLLSAFATQQDYFAQLESLIPATGAILSSAEAVEVSKQVLLGQLRHIRNNPALLEILRWELNEQNPVTDALTAKREEQGVALMDRIATFVDFSMVDFPAIGNLLLGGIYYLALRSRTVNEFSGVNLQSDEGWQRTEHAIDQLLTILGEYIDDSPQQ